MSMVAQMASLPFRGHERRIWVRLTDDKVCQAPITSTGDFALRASCLLNPVMPLLVGPGQVLSHGVFQMDRKWDGAAAVDSPTEGAGTGASPNGVASSRLVSGCEVAASLVRRDDST